MQNNTIYPISGFNLTDIQDILKRIVNFIGEPDIQNVDVENFKKEIWAVTGEYRIDLHQGSEVVDMGVL